MLQLTYGLLLLLLLLEEEASLQLPFTGTPKSWNAEVVVLPFAASKEPARTMSLVGCWSRFHRRVYKNTEPVVGSIRFPSGRKRPLSRISFANLGSFERSTDVLSQLWFHHCLQVVSWLFIEFIGAKVRWSFQGPPSTTSCHCPSDV